ncbi:MAG TPA: DUF885 domain-containing protein [Polyangia bacterium]|nr:DUF885 domain-containing protein [Polyangia bacterium]
MSPRILAAALAAALASPAFAVTPAPSESARFRELVDHYYDEYPRFHPSAATELGLHQHDAELESLSAESRRALAAWLHDYARRVAALDAARLTPAEQIDLATLKAGLDSSLVELEDVQGWQHRPDAYTGLASRSIYSIIKRDFAPADERLRSVIAREEKIPALLAEGKKNLSGVSKVSVEIALDEIDGIRDFFAKDVPLAFAAVKDKALRARLDAATKGVVLALVDYREFLKRDIQPHANAPFAIGEARFRKKLHADELIDAPLDELLQRGEAELRRLQAEFKATAQKIDPKKSAVEVQALMQKDHGTAERLIADTQARLAGLRKFLVDKQIVSLPSEIMPRVEETPPFMRATTLASMETPGAFETRATEAYYNVTLPEKSWSAEQIENYLGGAFSRPTIDVTSIHEAFPGHYVQYLWIPRLSSKVRKVEGVSTNVEGWAHYCEQMMLDEGYGAGDAKLRLAQLQDALLRAARFVVGIRMHTRGMTFEQGVEFFQREGFQEHKVAEMETRRGTEDPTYLYYTLGKLEILRLRDDYRRKLGAAYSLRKFHDAFLGEGAIPLPLMRRALLAE